MVGKKSVRILLSLICVGILAIGVVSCAKKTTTPAVTETEPRPAVEPEAPAVEPAPEAAPEEMSAEAKAQSQLQDVFFDFDKYNIRTDARDTLRMDYEVLQTVPDASIQIEGHCDERGTSEYNLALGQRRADAAKDYLVGLGMSGGKISTISYGKERPIDPGHDEAAWAQNRRAHIAIQGAM
ncbi:MAG: peptidoglycan-associated lipoprotein Pal [bacterium]